MDNQLKDLYSELISSNEPAPEIEPTSPEGQPNLSTNQTETPEPSSENEPTNGSVSSESSENQATPEAESEEGKSWDSFVEDAPASTTPEPSIDFTAIGKAIGAEVKSQDDLVGYVKSLNEQLSQAKSASYKDDPSLPDEVKEVIEVAKAGGDYLAILDVFSVDYSQEDPVELFESEVAELFYNEDGSFRQDEYDEYLDSLLPADKLMRGKAIQRELINMQIQKRSEIKHRAAEAKAQQLESIRQTLDGLDKIAGYNLTPKVKKQMFDSFATGQIHSQLGILPNGKFDSAKAVQTAFKAMYFDAIQSYLTTKARNEKTREVVEELANTNIQRAPQIENVAPNNKKPSAMDQYLEALVKEGVKR
jgi:hypothetical protein